MSSFSMDTSDCFCVYDLIKCRGPGVALQVSWVGAQGRSMNPFNDVDSTVTEKVEQI